MTTIKIIQNDVLYDLFFVLNDANGDPLNLENMSTSKFNVEASDGSGLKFSGDMEITGATTGEIKYTVQEGNFDTAGIYYAEIELKYISNQIVTVDEIKIFVQAEKN